MFPTALCAILYTVRPQILQIAVVVSSKCFQKQVSDFGGSKKEFVKTALETYLNPLTDSANIQKLLMF